jgi:hypothetical protein
VFLSTGASVTGSVTATGNVNTGSSVSAVGNVTAAGITTTGSGGAISGTGSVTAGSFTTTGNVTGGNILFGSGIISGTGNISGGNIIGTIVGTILTTSASLTGNLTAGNVNTGGLISATGTVTGSQFNGSGAGLTSIPGANVSGTVANATTAVVAGTVTTAAQGNITSVGTLTGLTINSATTAITNGAGNGVGNIGSSSTYFNKIFAQATTALYADLAEMYTTDAAYEPGTVVVFGGTQEVTISTTDSSRRVAGVVSTNPAHVMNSGLQGDHTIAVALTGRVPTSVVGTVAKGDMMVATGDGQARAEHNPILGSVIGKALEDFNGTEGMIEIVVGRL